MSAGIRLCLPATSANLGPGFDAVGLALSMHLTLEAREAAVFGITAVGRDTELCGDLENNLILNTYRAILRGAGKAITSVTLKLHNEIPLGMGCGSSAAALLAGVILADHFGDLRMDDEGIVAAASRLEGHPDNVAACWFGGFTMSCQEAETKVITASFSGDLGWEMLLVMQPTSLATKKARALLPEGYSRADAVFNMQRTALLVAAFASQRLDLLRVAMQDRVHQPYRMEACPLLRALLPLAEEREIAGVALSGAGPSVLVILSENTTVLEAETRVRAAVEGPVELIPVRIGGGVLRTLL